MWQATPETLGSSKSLTQTLSFGDSRLNVVLTQPTSSAFATPDAARNSTAAIKNNRFIEPISTLHCARDWEGGDGETAPPARAAESDAGGRILRTNRARNATRSEEHTSELQSRQYLVCRLL